MSDAPFTFWVDESLKDQFSAAAKERNRTAAQLSRDFMRDFVSQQNEALDHDAWVRRRVQKSLESANAGRLISSEAVEAEFAERRARTRQRVESQS